MAPTKKALRETIHSRRQYQLLPAVDGNTSWDDVPDDVILGLVRGYSRLGDAILFGTSKDQEVLAIRVYRAGYGYSVYTRNLAGLGEALDRLERYRPRREAVKRPSPGGVTAGQVLSNPPPGGEPWWYSLPPVQRQENPISPDKLRTLELILSNRRRNQVAFVAE